MDPRIDIWNVLHDGEFTVLAVRDNVLTMFVNIPYLRARLTPLGDSLVLRLKGFRSFSLLDSGGRLESTNPADVTRSGQVILSAASDDFPVTVALRGGSMTLDFDDLEVALDTGSTVDYAVVRRAAEDYWTEWEAKARRAIPKADPAHVAPGVACNPPPPQGSLYSVFITAFDSKWKIQAIKAIREETGLGLADAKNLVEGTSHVLLAGLAQSEAEAVAARLRAQRLTVELRKDPVQAE